MTSALIPYVIGGAFFPWLLLPWLAIFGGRDTNKKLWSALIGIGALGMLAAAGCAFLSPEYSFALASPFHLGVAPLAFATMSG